MCIRDRSGASDPSTGYYPITRPKTNAWNKPKQKSTISHCAIWLNKAMTVLRDKRREGGKQFKVCNWLNHTNCTQALLILNSVQTFGITYHRVNTPIKLSTTLTDNSSYWPADLPATIPEWPLHHSTTVRTLGWTCTSSANPEPDCTLGSTVPCTQIYLFYQLYSLRCKTDLKQTLVQRCQVWHWPQTIPSSTVPGVRLTSNKP